MREGEKEVGRFASGGTLNLLVAGFFVIFVIAAGFRLLYQQESIVDRPIRADAAVYMKVAEAMYLQRQGIDMGRDPFEGVPARYKRGALYPRFVSFFFEQPGDQYGDVLQRVLLAQAVMGGLMAVVTSMIGMAFLPPGLAFAGGLLVAVNPHLIAVDGYLLTEGLFTFTVMVGAGLVTLAVLQTQRGGEKRFMTASLAFMAGVILFQLSGLIRPTNLLLTPFMVTGLLFAGLWHKRSSFKHRWHNVWHPRLRLSYTLILLLAGGVWFLPGFRGLQWSGPKHEPAFLPFIIQGGWISFLQGLEPGFYQPGSDAQWNNAAWRHDPDYRLMVSDPAQGWQIVKERIVDRPLDYLGWFTAGKSFFSWGWDNIYNGDVYIYPMIRRGFDEHSWLRFIHSLWQRIQVPVFVLAWLSIPLALMVQMYTKRSMPLAKLVGAHSSVDATSQSRSGVPASLSEIRSSEGLVLMPVILTWLYGVLLLSILTPLPRYSIPLRPVAVLLALSAIYNVYRMVQQRLKNTQEVFTKS